MRKREKTAILAARIVSLVFTPFYLPLVGLMALFAFSYLSLMPWAYKLQVLTHTGVCVHHPPAHGAHPSLSPLSGVEPH